MKKLFYVLAFVLIAISVFFNVSAYAAGSGTDGSGSWTPLPDPSYPGGGGSFGGGGSWGNSGGFGGNGGFSGDSPNQCSYTVRGGPPASSAIAACKEWVEPQVSFSRNFRMIGQECHYEISNYGDSWRAGYAPNVDENCTPPPDCPDGESWNGSVCVPPIKCPQGYTKQGDQCVWQCPAGYKDMGGSCVKDDMPEDCDPAIQECNEDGTPKCDPCSKLQQLINNNLTMINNDNRVISLTETLVSNQNTTNNNLNNVNNNINNVSNNLNTINDNMSIVNNNIKNINESVQNVITAIENNKPDFDTSAIEAMLQQLIDKETTVNVPDIEIDLTELLAKLDVLEQAIIDNKYDDTELKAKIDELINKDLSEITDRQDEQTSLLEDIKRLLLPTNEAGDPDLNLPEVEQSSFDPWGAIKGFNINQNLINATGECPADKTFTVMGATFSIPMTPMCTYLGYLAPIFLALAYFQGAMIILRSGD